jgi:hypothetical protein
MMGPAPTMRIFSRSIRLGIPPIPSTDYLPTAPMCDGGQSTNCPPLWMGEKTWIQLHPLALSGVLAEHDAEALEQIR